MNKYVKALINVNKFATENITVLEQYCQEAKPCNEREKADFGNACIALHGFRDVADATESMLINAGVFKDDNGNFFEKINTDFPENKDDNDAPANEQRTESNDGKSE